MKVRTIAGATVLLGLVAAYADAYRREVNQEIAFRKPLTATEIHGLAAINVGQRDCSWPYDLTKGGEMLRRRFHAQRDVDATLQARFMAAQKKYDGLSPDEQCALLDRFPELVRQWRD